MTTSRSEPASRPNPDLTPGPGSGTEWTVPDRDPRSPDSVRRRRGPDLRLVPVALTVWLTVTLTIVTRTPWPAVACSVVVAASLVVMRWAGPWRSGTVVDEAQGRIMVRTLALAMLVGAAWSARAGWLVARVDRHVLRHGHSRWDGPVTVATAPKQLDSGTVLINVTVEDLGTVPVFLGDRTDSANPRSELLDLQPGTLLQLTATAKESDRSSSLVPLSLNAQEVPEVIRSPDGIAGITAHLRGSLRDAAEGLPWGTGELIPGMVVGDVSMQQPGTREEFLATGLTHLTAVSGANLAIVTGSVLVLATALGAPRWSQLVAAAVCLVAFVALVGPEPSVLRAAVMGGVGLVAVWSARRTHGFAALSAAVLVLLAVDPGLAVEYAFILSAVATAGIVALAPLVTRRILQVWTDRRTARAGSHDPPARWQAMLVGLVAVSLAADVVTAPVIVQMTGVFSPTAVLANVLVGAAVPVVTVIGMLGALVAGLHVGAGVVVLTAAAPPAWWILTVASGLSSIDVLHTPGGFGWAGLVVLSGTGLVTIVVSTRWRAAASTGLAGVIVVVLVGFHRGTLTTGPYSEKSGQDVGLVRTWSEDLDEVEWYLGIRPAEGASDAGPPDIFAAPGTDPSAFEVVFLVDEGSVLTEERRRTNTGAPPPELYVVTSCGRSRGMPSQTPAGVPVAFPCRDGTVVLASDGLHASGK
ncbi:MAG TPA: ComEC/Rec2 family competence protein [Candidatus Corynebacterium avicola]|uniref:ComEC/Rec2 family competence protein n=1 Tax=Candidatus Corynebacterium avicola TaxID=2838527 RepID=A0A9D1RRX0_9CORY|nr:ComEC/Rec2 family competence protein [Candidatus Corynebacterium avicola]